MFLILSWIILYILEFVSLKKEVPLKYLIKIILSPWILESEILRTEFYFFSK